jgi:Electron transfer DM13
MKLVRALILVVAAAATTAAGVYVAGGVITNDFRASMALTAIWFAAAAAIALASFNAGRSIGLPILAGYLIAATAIGGYLASTTLIDKTVDEVVVMADPVPAAEAAEREQPRKPRNVLESRGTFTSGEHATTGTARVIRLPNGRRVLTLTNFETDAGPDLRARIGDVDLGALKGNKGDQQYDIPEGFKPRDHSVLIWCRAFSALFGSAQLEPA